MTCKFCVISDMCRSNCNQVLVDVVQSNDQVLHVGVYDSGRRIIIIIHNRVVRAQGMFVSFKVHSSKVQSSKFQSSSFQVQKSKVQSSKVQSLKVQSSFVGLVKY